MIDDGSIARHVDGAATGAAEDRPRREATGALLLLLKAGACVAVAMLKLVKAILKGSLGRNEGGGSLRALRRLGKLLLHKVNRKEHGEIGFDCAIASGTVV